MAFYWSRAGVEVCSVSLIHFRISQGIDEELSLAAEAFLEGEDGCVLNMPKREVNPAGVVQIK